MAAVMITGFRGDGRRGLDGCVANTVGRRSGEDRGAGGEVPLGTLHMHAVRDEDTEKEYGEGRHAQQWTRSGADPDAAPGRPSRNHAVILTARRLWSATGPAHRTSVRVPGLFRSRCSATVSKTRPRRRRPTLGLAMGTGTDAAIEAGDLTRAG
jgi:hypothetical protein